MACMAALSPVGEMPEQHSEGARAEQAANSVEAAPLGQERCGLHRAPIQGRVEQALERIDEVLGGHGLTIAPPGALAQMECIRLAVRGDVVAAGRARTWLEILVKGEQRLEDLADDRCLGGEVAAIRIQVVRLALERVDGDLLGARGLAGGLRGRYCGRAGWLCTRG